jgi:FkbM family methyltransferase
MKKYIKRVFDSLEFRLGIVKMDPKTNFFKVRQRIINNLRVATVIDVGANVGQWLKAVNPSSIDGSVWCFEPLEVPFKELEKCAKSYPNVKVFKLAFSDFAGSANMFVASNGGASSSISAPTEHLKLHSAIEFSKSETVKVSTIDEFFSKHELSLPVYLKIDTQGHEWNVIKGGIKTLKSVAVVELESSMTAQYQGEKAHHDLMNEIINLGFVYYTGSNPRVDEFGRQWDLNSILVNKIYLESNLGKTSWKY